MTAARRLALCPPRNIDLAKLRHAFADVRVPGAACCWRRVAACGGVAAIRRRFHPSNILPISCVCATGEGSEYKRRVRDRKSFSAAATVSRRPSHNPLKETRPPPPPPPDVNPHAQIARTPSVSSARFGVVHFFLFRFCYMYMYFKREI